MGKININKVFKKYHRKAREEIVVHKLTHRYLSLLNKEKVDRTMLDEIYNSPKTLVSEGKKRAIIKILKNKTL